MIIVPAMCIQDSVRPRYRRTNRPVRASIPLNEQLFMAAISAAWKCTFFSEKLPEGSGCSLKSTPCRAEGRAYFAQHERSWFGRSNDHYRSEISERILLQTDLMFYESNTAEV
jgi:hypothetical protein